jgi:polysaccharide deacetylase 2 family uncharacterized protein YibQ
MRNIVSYFISKFQKAPQAFRIISVIFLLLIVMIGGKKFWTGGETKTQTEPQSQVSSTTLDGVSDTSLNKSEEVEGDNDEEEHEEEETTSPNSSWSLLNSALPARYYEPIVKKQAPSVAIILTGLGLNTTWTEKVLSTVSKKTTLAFSPYSPNLNDLLQRTKTLGFNTLVGLPMEPHAYPNQDPGPYTLLTGAKDGENIRKTKLILDNIPNGIGIIGEYGSQFTLSKVDLEPVLKEIKNRGSVFIDPNTTLHSQVQSTCKALEITCPQVDLTLPISSNSAEEDNFLKKIIQNAKENGIIVISVPAIPAFVQHLPEWLDTIEKNGINVVSITELKSPELSLDISRKHQGSTHANKQDSHQPG